MGVHRVPRPSGPIYVLVSLNFLLCFGHLKLAFSAFAWLQKAIYSRPPISHATLTFLDLPLLVSRLHLFPLLPLSLAFFFNTSRAAIYIGQLALQAAGGVKVLTGSRDTVRICWHSLSTRFYVPCPTDHGGIIYLRSSVSSWSCGVFSWERSHSASEQAWCLCRDQKR